MKFLPRKILFAATALFAVLRVPAPAAENDDAALRERVYVVANAADAESLDVARHYVAARGVPEKNLIALTLPREETISWRVFADEVHFPLLHELCARGLVDGAPTEKRDAAGRVLLALPANFDPTKARAGERIAYLVLCRGVPLRIANDPEKLAPLAEGATRAPLDKNEASVDSELALVAVPDAPINGAVPNPFFRDAKNRVLSRLLLKVARLDGPTAEDAKALTESALRAEAKGLMGRACVDRGGPHKEGDAWLEATEKTLRGLGFETSAETTRALMPATSRYDAPAFYFGWYSARVGGCFLDPKFRFPAGACAMHIHSFSAETLRSRSAWTAGLVARGAAATVGNVFEPYLGLSHHPHYFAEALASGMTAGDAAAFSIPAFSWQGVFVGDPLYRPFKKSLDAQLNDAREGRPTRLHQYAYLRAAQLARAEGRDGDAEKLLDEARLYAPGLALEYAIARSRDGKNPRAAWTYFPRNFAAENPGLALEVARFLAEHGNADRAAEFYRATLDGRLVPEFARADALAEAVACAERHRVASAPVAEWKRELQRLRAKKK